ncbi:hypothetical protein, conserved [Leishmania tarentolae]|uniref:Uncharacterized protein n=1 Tax=Leishmania tarentolae TaxID=5689 RepID=A0A640KAX8_LEITA|nr:hypothetical protein, conserved [Leishmania tarentolae]
MSISSSLTYALLCVYYACHTALLFTVEILLFLPSYYLVERHDTPSAWLGRRGEAQVQPVLSTAYEYQRTEERDKLSCSETANIVPVGTAAPLLDSSTREVEENRCILLRRSVSRLRSLHAPVVSSRWWPQVPPSLKPPLAKTQLLQHNQPQSTLPSWHDRPQPALTQSPRDSIEGVDDMNASLGSSSNYTIHATPVETITHRPSSLYVAEASGWRDGTLRDDRFSLSLQSNPMYCSHPVQLHRGTHQHPCVRAFDDEHAACTSSNGHLSTTADDAADSGFQQSCVTDAFFDGAVVNVLASPQEKHQQQQQQQDHLASARKRVRLTGAEGLLARLSHRRRGVASHRTTARSSSVPPYAAAARERMRATVPMWCTVAFHSHRPQSVTRGRVIESASSSFRGQYGFLPPWYAVHARAQLLLALVDPLLRTAAELLWCRGWATSTASSAAQTEKLDALGRTSTASARGVSPEHQQVSQQDTRSPPLPLSSVHGCWQNAGTFLFVPFLMCFRVLRSLFYGIMGTPEAMAASHCSTWTSALRTLPNAAGGGCFWHLFRPFEGTVQALVDRYIADTHIFEPLYTNADATMATVPSAAVNAEVNSAVSPAAHALSKPTTTSAKASGAARRQDHAASLSHPAPYTSAPTPACQKSAGVYWLHGRRPPIWPTAPAENSLTASTPPLCSPAPVVVLLLCPSLLQGSGLYQHTVTRISYVCQLLTLVGAWQASLSTEDAAGDPIVFPSSRDIAMMRTATPNGDDSAESNDAAGCAAACAENAYKPLMTSNRSNNCGSIQSSGAGANDQSSPPETSSLLPWATRPTSRSATQWYAAVPVVELRVPATSPERADDVSMPPLTLKDLRHIVERLRHNLEARTPSATSHSESCASAAAGRSAFLDLFNYSTSSEAAVELPASPHPRRPVYIVAVGWSEAASPLLELAITQQQHEQPPQQTSTGGVRSTRDENGGHSREEAPAHLDGLVCISHTLSSAFQLLPQRSAEGRMVQRCTREVSHGVTSTASRGGVRSTLLTPASASPLVAARLVAASRMPRILSSLTTGPARLLVLLTRMQLIADTLLAHRQHQEQWHGGRLAVVGDARIPRTMGSFNYAERHALMLPEDKAHKQAGAPLSQMPDMSFYHILHVFREAREEVNRAQRGLDRATITWTHQQHQQQHPTRAVQRDSVFDCFSSVNVDNSSALMSRATEDDVEQSMPCTAAAAPHSQLTHRERHSLPPSPASVDATSVPDWTTNSLRHNSLTTAPLSKMVRVFSPLDSYTSMPVMASSGHAGAGSASPGSNENVGAQGGAVEEVNVPAAPAFTSGRGSSALPLLTVDQDTSLLHYQTQTLSFSDHYRGKSPLLMGQDLVRESSALRDLPHLESATDWEELVKSAMMAEVQKQQHRVAANTAMKDLPPTCSFDFPLLLHSSGRQHFRSIVWTDEEGEGHPASSSLVAQSFSFVGNSMQGACSHMSTDDVLASCTLQMLSPTARQATRLPRGDAVGAPKTAVASRGVASACSRETRNRLENHSKEASTAGEEATLLAGATKMKTHLLHSSVASGLDSAYKACVAPSFPSEQPTSSEFSSPDAVPAPSAHTSASKTTTTALSTSIPTSADGGHSNVCIVGTEGKRCSAASPSDLPTWQGASLHLPERTLRSPIPRCGSHSFAQPLFSLPTSPSQPQQPLPYPPPSRSPGLSSQTAALVELRVRSAQHAALIQRIRVPTLLVHARDDPVAPTSTLPFSLLQANPWITTVLTRRGSHGVFMEGASEVLRRPRLVVTERSRPAKRMRPTSGASVVDDMVYCPGSGLDDAGCAPGSTDEFHWTPLPAPSSSRGDHAVSSPTAGAHQPSAVLRAAVASQEAFPPPPKEQAKCVHGGGPSSSSTSDLHDEEDTVGGAIGEGPPRAARDSDATQYTGMRQCTASPTRPKKGQQSVAAATTSTWQVRIDGTTWLERVLFEYVEKVIVCTPAALS